MINEKNINCCCFLNNNLNSVLRIPIKLDLSLVSEIVSLVSKLNKFQSIKPADLNISMFLSGLDGFHSKHIA